MSNLSKAEKMGLMVETWKESGMNKKDFAFENGIKYGTFQYWTRKIYPDEAPKRKSSICSQDLSFIELTEEDFKQDHLRTPQIELTLPNGIQVKIY